MHGKFQWRVNMNRLGTNKFLNLMFMVPYILVMYMFDSESN
jgi:hypothetical protein